MTVDAVTQIIRTDRRRQMRAFLEAVRWLSVADRFTERVSGYDPRAYRRWLDGAM